MVLKNLLVLCFILLMFCVIGIANGPEKFTVFYEKNVQEKAIKLGYYEKNVQEKAIKLGYTTQKEIKKQTIISIIVLYLPCFILVPLMVCYINDAKEFGNIFIQSLFIMYIMGLFDNFYSKFIYNVYNGTI